MQKRKLGKSNLEVSAIGLGCMGMSFTITAPPTDRNAMIALIRAAVDLRRYVFRYRRSLRPVHQRRTRGRSPRSVSASEVVIATKFGFNVENGKPDRGLNSRPEHIQPSRRRIAQTAQSPKRIDLLLPAPR